MILEIDVGNTRTKWRVRCGDEIRFCGNTLSAELFDEFSSLFADTKVADVKVDDIQEIYVSSVVASYYQRLRSSIEQHFGISPKFAGTQKFCAGVTNAYEHVEQMGVDRWLALVAAFNKGYGDAVIVDAGSAVTVDLLCADGKHLGGYIAPGLELMRKTLFKTDQVSIHLEDYPDALSPGESTERAVLSALPLMVLGLIDQAIQQFSNISGRSPALLLTGGNGEYLLKMLRDKPYSSVVLDVDLVLDGLRFSVVDQGNRV